MNAELKRAKAREASRRWRANNPEKVKAANDARDPTKTAEASRAWQDKNPNKAEAISKAWKKDNPARVLWQACKGRAHQKGYAFDLTVALVEKLLEPMKCSISGLLLSFEKAGNSQTNPWAPSIDKIRPNEGYVQGNVRLVCWAFNQMRGDFPDEVVYQLARALINNFEAVEE
jgi:hypothetical protein